MYNILHKKNSNYPQGGRGGGGGVDTSNIQPVELVYMDFAFYNVTFIHSFTSMITAVCVKTRMLWVFSTAYKRAPVRIIHFILTTLMNEQHPFKRVRVD